MIKLWILTNTKLPESSASEDRLISEMLNEFFDVKLIDIYDQNILNYWIKNFLLRNTWTSTSDLEEIHKNIEIEDIVFENLYKNNFFTYNAINKKSWNKKYLAKLFDINAPVIPTISNIKELSRLWLHENYFIKNLKSWDWIWSKKLTKKELLKQDLKYYIIQPYISNAVSEISFYMIDWEVIYALETTSKNDRWDLKETQLKKQYIDFAKYFWNYEWMKYWFLRVDAMKLPDDSLLLTEFEGNWAYLSIECLPKKSQKNFINILSNSILNNINKYWK